MRIREVSNKAEKLIETGKEVEAKRDRAMSNVQNAQRRVSSAQSALDRASQTDEEGNPVGDVGAAQAELDAAIMDLEYREDELREAEAELEAINAEKQETIQTLDQYNAGESSNLSVIKQLQAKQFGGNVAAMAAAIVGQMNLAESTKAALYQSMGQGYSAQHFSSGSGSASGGFSGSNVRPRSFSGNDSSVSGRTRRNLGAFEQNRWNGLSQSEREQAVVQLRDSIAEELGLENKPNVAYYNNEDPGDYGGYAASNNTIYINRFNMDDAAETADTVAHESRHCWQHERADNPQNEQDYLFKENFEDYIRPEDDFYEYQNQPVEADARDYAQNVKNAIPISDETPNMSAGKTVEGNDTKDNAPPTTTGPPENTDNKSTVNTSDLPADFKRKTEFTPVSDAVKKSLEGSGLTDDKINEIRNKPKPDYENGEAVNPNVHKPDPSTYLKPEYVSEHLEPFKKSGCFKLMKSDPTNPNHIYGGTVGHSSGTFVTSGEALKKAIQESGGDVKKMKEILGLGDGDLGNNPTIISFNSPSNLRMPSGNELGATQKKFIPGGFTSGNQPEAVIDSVQKGDYKVTKFKNPNIIDWIDKRGET